MDRCERLAAWLEEGCAALITSPANMRYLCGFSCEGGVALITSGGSYLIVESRYYAQARAKAVGCEVVLSRDSCSQISDILINSGEHRVLTEAAFMPISVFEAYKASLVYSSVEASKELSDALAAMRMIKSAEEIKLISEAQRIAEQAYERLLNTIRRSMTERQAAALLDYYIMECGADGIAFPTIAATGANGAFPHAVPTDNRLCEGSFLVLDFGAELCGYRSDMARTLAVGKISPKQEEVYNAVSCAQRDALEALRAGINGKVVDSVARSTLAAWGFDRYFTHGLGHGIGIEPHEPPQISRSSGDMLREGMVVAIETGVYIPDSLGVRIEDMAVVTKDGCISLTSTTKSLIRI